MILHSHHCRLLKRGLDTNPKTATALIQAAHDSLPAPTSLSYALFLFDRVPPPSRDVAIHATLISLFPLASTHFYTQFLTRSIATVKSHPFILSSLARAAGTTSSPNLAQLAHCHAIRCGLDAHVVVSTSLLNSYAKSNHLNTARKVFDGMPEKNIVTWNSMLSAYANSSECYSAIQMFCSLRRVEFDMEIDEYTASTVLAACSRALELGFGEQVHAFVVVNGLETDSGVSGAITNLYFRCGKVECAERVTEKKDIAMMINGYVSNGRYIDAFNMFTHGNDLVRVLLKDCSVSISTITACGNLGFARIGRKVHAIVTLLRYENFALGSALIDMYCKCGSVEEARGVLLSLKEKDVSHYNSMIAGCVRCGYIEKARSYFDEMVHKNVISWSCMISGYVKYGMAEEGLKLMRRMCSEDESVKANCYTFVSVLNACSSLAALKVGKEVHGQVLKTVSNVVLETALLDMYSKAGALRYGERVFEKMERKNVVSWTSMLSCYASHGHGHEAIDTFERMMWMGVKPNEVTFVAILTSCSRCGLVKEGLHYFNLMRGKYGISPRGDHYACLVDMFGRAGELEEAWKVVKEIEDDVLDGDDGAVIWNTLLGACQMHDDADMVSKVSEEMMKRGKANLDAYVVMSNVYANAGMWECVDTVREELKRHGAVKEPGLSQIRTFVSKDEIKRAVGSAKDSDC